MAKDYTEFELRDELEQLDIDLDDLAIDEEIDEQALEIIELFREIGRDFGEIIADENFQDFTKRYCSDNCAVEAPDEFPFCFIDWEAASDSLKDDYVEVDFRGSTYWVIP